MTNSPSTNKPEPLALVACKAIMRSRVSGSAKAVGAILIDHVNWQDHRCDPGLSRIALLTGHSRSTVQSGIDQLVDDRVLSVRLHGGRSGRNHYDFDWDEIRRRDAIMQAALKGGRKSPGGSGLSRPETRAQTRLSNPCTEPVAPADSGYAAQRPDRRNGPARKTPSTQRGLVHRETGRASTVDRQEAAAAAAERRWSKDLLDRLGSRLKLYAAAVDAIDDRIRSVATEAEMRRRGAGLPAVLKQLRLAGIKEVQHDVGQIDVATDIHGSSQPTLPLAVVSSTDTSAASADFQSLKSKPEEG